MTCFALHFSYPGSQHNLTLALNFYDAVRIRDVSENRTTTWIGCSLAVPDLTLALKFYDGRTYGTRKEYSTVVCSGCKSRRTLLRKTFTIEYINMTNMSNRFWESI
eukprot:scaffold8962_cov123-Cylindrotheca_fusiformis.AAC.5